MPGYRRPSARPARPSVRCRWQPCARRAGCSSGSACRPTGMAGHLDEFWPDIARSGWIGGDAEGWERGPYWLDGIVRLAYVLDDERLKAKVAAGSDHILEHQHPDGWFGPRSGDSDVRGSRRLAAVIVPKAMLQYLDATGDAPWSRRRCGSSRLLDGCSTSGRLHEWARIAVDRHGLGHPLAARPDRRGLAAAVGERSARRRASTGSGVRRRLPFTEKVTKQRCWRSRTRHDGDWMQRRLPVLATASTSRWVSRRMPVWWRQRLGRPSRPGCCR